MFRRLRRLLYRQRAGASFGIRPPFFYLPDKGEVYHLPFLILPVIRIVAKAMTMNNPEIHMGDNTHSHDHETNPVSFNTIKISVKVDITPRLERLAFWLIRISPLQLRICRIIYCFIISCHSEKHKGGNSRPRPCALFVTSRQYRCRYFRSHT